MIETETIAALCTAPGGALAIIRISGAEALDVADKVWTSSKKMNKAEPRRLLFGHIRHADGMLGETCLAVYMPGPASYTGEDVVELQCHGGVLSPKLLLEAVYHAGARPASAGEFTRRAFLNGKMDLSQAEAVADIFSAGSKASCHLAERQLSGVLGGHIRSDRDALNHVLAEIESHLDFPEENLDWIPVDELKNRIDIVRADLKKLLSSQTAGAVYRDGIRLVIAGSPNTGKSSLLNWLLGYDRAIVSDIPGTTRDTLNESVTLRGIPVTLTDTAGLREHGADAVEDLGIARSRNSIKGAEVVLWMFDSSAAFSEDLAKMKELVPAGTPVIAVWNKIDLTKNFQLPETGTSAVAVSVREQTGLEKLLDLFENAAWNGASDRSEPDCAIAARHAAALNEALDSLNSAYEVINEDSFELAASGLRAAAEALGRITGETARVDVLDEIFSRFCIGK